MGKQKVDAWKCNVCRHVWLGRRVKGKPQRPLRCAKCKTPYWDRPRRKDKAAVSGPLFAATN